MDSQLAVYLKNDGWGTYDMAAGPRNVPYEIGGQKQQLPAISASYQRYLCPLSDRETLGSHTNLVLSVPAPDVGRFSLLYGAKHFSETGSSSIL